MTLPYKNCILLKLNDENYCQVHKYGATLVKWVCKGEDRIFLSSDAVLDGTSAIRGGIPVVFPNFGPWSLGPQHGFARKSWWNLSKQPLTNEMGNVEAEMCLRDNEETRAMWNYRFEVKLKFELAFKDLKMSFSVLNKDTNAFTFTCLLHSYLQLDDVTLTRVSGLVGSQLDDRINKIKESYVKEGELVINGLIDSVYHGIKSEAITISNTRAEESIQIVSKGFPDLVVWNPWEEKAGLMKDLRGDQWRRMLCVEVGKVVEPITLQTSEVYSASQNISVLD